MTKTKLAGTLLALGALAIPAHAGVVFVGSLQDDSSSEISQWNRTTTAKSLDLDGNNFYGSDGYTWMNTNDAFGGGPQGVLDSVVESAPGYTGGIAYTGAVGGVSGSFGGADDRRNAADTADVNVGYAGVNYNNTTGATVLQEIFAYTLNRDMLAGETIRLGVVLDSLADLVIGSDSLRVVAGGSADATIVANSRSQIMDMYFFDITGLSSGEEIQIWGAKSADNSNFGYNAITIGGVTFDSVIPEPSTMVSVMLSAVLFGFRRRR